MWRAPLAWALVLTGLVLVALGTGVGRAPEPTPGLSARQVLVRVDGRDVATVAVSSPWPADALTLAGVPWFPGDEVRLNGLPWEPDRTWPEDAGLAVLLDLRRARLWRWQGPQGARGATRAVAASPAEALALALPLHPGDLWSAQAGVWHWHPAREVVVRTPQAEHRARLAARSVGHALARLRVPLLGLDGVTPAETEPLPDGVPLRVHRVTEAWVSRQESLPYDNEVRALPEVELDTVQVVQEGRPGIKVRWERVRYVDGEEAQRLPVGEWVVQEPQPRVVGYGTKVVVRTLDTPDGPIRYWRAVRVYATSYSPCRVGGGRCSSTTASGARLQKGVIAVTVPWYRSMKGMQVYVPGYGFGRILDTGGGIPGRPWIDLGYSDDDYVSWHQWTTLYFLAPPPPPEEILYVLP